MGKILKFKKVKRKNVKKEVILSEEEKLACELAKQVAKMLKEDQVEAEN
jgi:hypothetical protein